MKSSKLPPYQRANRRDAIMQKREATRRLHISRGRTHVQYRTTKFDKHQSDRQTARYARQTGYIAPTPPPVPVKPKRAPRARKTG